jgi:hypothetical protein
MKYFVKTRNWNCNKFVHKLIALAPNERGDGYTDGDGKFYHETNSLIIGLLILLYWKILSYWSGGYTYIIDRIKYADGSANDFKTFYL